MQSMILFIISLYLFTSAVMLSHYYSMFSVVRKNDKYAQITALLNPVGLV